MIGHIPQRPTGNSPQAIFMQWVYDRLVIEDREISVSGTGVCRTTRGFYQLPGSVSSTSVSQFKLRDVKDNYLVCRDFVGGTVGSIDVYVAKPYKLRCGLEKEKILGSEYTYTYADGTDAKNPTRTSTKVSDSTTEAQRVVPPWVVMVPVDPATTPPTWEKYTYADASKVFKGDTIYAIPAPTGVFRNNLELSLLMIGEARQWSQIS